MSSSTVTTAATLLRPKSSLETNSARLGSETGGGVVGGGLQVNMFLNGASGVIGGGLEGERGA